MKIYIDDNNISCECLPPGSRFIDGKVRIIESEIESDKEIPGDLRTSRILLEIGNSVSHLTLTSDCPSQHPTNFMPILDLQCTVRENKILFKFFKKPMANPLLMTKSSAMPYQVKRASLAQEALRRLRNTSRSLPWSEAAEILSEYSHKLMLSGWSEADRYDFISAGLAGYRSQCKRSDSGEVPLYRPREWERATRKKKKDLAPHIWYRPADTVMFVPGTARSELKQRVQNIVTRKTAELGLTVRVVETGGIKIKDKLVKLDLTGCIFPTCRACKSGLDGASHTRSGAQYHITCNVCQADNIVAAYEGETGWNAMYRLNEHEDAIKTKNLNNGMAKHLAVHHPDKQGDPDNFQYSCVSTFKKCLEREVSEGIVISNSKADIIMNSKSEHHQPAIHRTTVTREVRHGS